MRWISLMTCVAGMLCYLSLPAQKTDSSRIDKIRVGLPPSMTPKDRQYQHHYAHQRDFFRRRELRVINFNRIASAPLNEAYCEAFPAPAPGLVQHLVHGLFLKNIRALDPSRPTQAYGYIDLFMDMIRLQQIPIDSLEGLAREDLNWTALEQVMLMVRVRGYDNQQAIEFDEVELLQLVWVDRQQGQRHVLAVFIIDDIRPWLEELRCTWINQQGKRTGTNAFRWLHAMRGEYPQVDFDTEAMPTLPADRLSLDAWPTFYPSPNIQY